MRLDCYEDSKGSLCLLLGEGDTVLLIEEGLLAIGLCHQPVIAGCWPVCVVFCD